jgi:hypothetical protein
MEEGGLMAKRRIPPLSEYVREQDLIRERLPAGREPLTIRVHEVIDAGVMTSVGFIPTADLDSLWRLVLCRETVNVGDVLLWNDSRSKRQITVTFVLPTGIDYKMRHGFGGKDWCRVDADCLMLKRATVKLPEEQPR